MELMRARRRLLMQPSGTSELYPIGTNLYDGLYFYTSCDIDNTTGQLIDGNETISDYIEVSRDYEYTRSYRLYGVYNYDADYNYLGYQAGANNLQTSVLSAFLPGTKYIRTNVHSSYVSDTTHLVIRNNCWLKRTA